ncbi:MAG: hypothetical protein E7623_05090 [Ruminococcaceae bacterium]|nr:hypothetical protein [Oscillospiraceae bacterium]
MKNAFFIFFIILILLGISSCKNSVDHIESESLAGSMIQKDETESEGEAIYITDIKDRDTMDTQVDVFFTGIDMYYYFPTVHETTVFYSDGSTQSLKEAMLEFRVTLDDLDKFDIKYYSALIE